MVAVEFRGHVCDPLGITAAVADARRARDERSRMLEVKDVSDNPIQYRRGSRLHLTLSNSNQDSNPGKWRGSSRAASCV
jgi:hypothetical protein